MLIEFELALLCVLVGLPALAKLKKEKPKQPTAPLAIRPDWWEQAKIGGTVTVDTPAASHEIVKRVRDKWIHVGFRRPHHPDVQEALDTPGLAVRHSDGRIEEGNQ